MRRQDLLKGCALLFDVFRARVVGARIHAAGNPTPRVLPGGECSELMDESKHLQQSQTAESRGGTRALTGHAACPASGLARPA